MCERRACLRSCSPEEPTIDSVQLHHFQYLIRQDMMAHLNREDKTEERVDESSESVASVVTSGDESSKMVTEVEMFWVDSNDKHE